MNLVFGLRQMLNLLFITNMNRSSVRMITILRM